MIRLFAVGFMSADICDHIAFFPLVQWNGIGAQAAVMELDVERRMLLS